MCEDLHLSKQGTPNPERPRVLSAENQELIEAPDFHELFNDSILVNPETDQPQLWYHGTNRQFENFTKPSNLGTMSNFGLTHDKAGIFFSESLPFVHQYADRLGANIDFYMERVNLAKGGASWSDAIGHWARFVDDLAYREEAFAAKSSMADPAVPLREWLAPDSEHKPDHSDFIFWDGEIIGMLGDYLAAFGGRFPDTNDIISPYEPISPYAIERVIRARMRGSILVMPERARPRIIPAFISATAVHTVEKTGTNEQDMDNGFDEGLEILAEKPDTQAIIVEPTSAEAVFKRSVLVLDASRIIIAASV